MGAGPVKVSVLADTSDLKKATAAANGDLEEIAATAQKAGAKMESAFSGVAEGSDHMASKGSQAAGALSGLGGLAGMAGGKLGALGTGMTVAGTAAQALADSGDLLNVVTESTIVKSALAKVQIAAQTAATVAANVATKTWTAGQWLLNAALEANPIGLVIAAIAALAAGIVLAYKKSDTFRSIVNGAFNAVKNTVSTVWDKISGILSKFKSGISAVGDTAGALKRTISDDFDGIWNKISSLPGKVTGLADDMLKAGKGLASNLVSGIKSIGGDAGSIATSIVNKVIDFLNSILPHSLNTHIPGVGTVNLIPNITHLANGGITTGPTMALIGDNPGGREAVIPLDKYPNALGGGNTYYLTVNAPVGSSSAEIGRTLVQHITAFERSGGRRRAN